MFFGRIVKEGKTQPLVPHADGFSLHLSQVSIPATAKEGTRVSLLIKVGDEEPVVLCTLCAGSQDTVLLDQFVDEYAELSVEGSCDVHVTGYYSPQFNDADDDEGEEYEDDEFGAQPMHAMFGDGSDDEDETNDEDEGDDEDESDDVDSDDFLRAHHKEPSVIIEDITDQEQQDQKALPAPAEDTKKRKADVSSEQTATKKQAVKPAEQKKQAKQQQQQETEQQQKEPKSEQKQGAKDKQQPKQDQQQKGKQKTQQQQQQQQRAAKTPEKKSDATETAAQALSSKKGVRRYENGFEVHNIKMGEPHGKLAKAGKQVKVKYVGKLKNGKVFDKSKGPFKFRLGVGEVIKGWDAGVEGMRVGDVRRLVIPPQMGYGSQKTGPIPPNSVLDFEVELVDVK